MKTNYDGYIFSNMIRENLENYKMYNSNMTLYFLASYKQQNEIPEELVDTNIISDYSKIESFMDLCQNMNKIELLEKIVAGDLIESELTERFNAEIEFGEKELVSLLFYLGYLTIKEINFGVLEFGCPNEVIRKIYSDYFLEYIKRKGDLTYEINQKEILKEILLEGKIDKLLKILEEFLINLSNRDYQRFDEKYVKVIFYSICRMLKGLYVKSELELSGQYADILLIPKEELKERYSILIEFKYIKQEDYDKDTTILQTKQKQARIQLEAYKKSEEIIMLPKFKSYSIVVIKDKIFVEEI